MLIVGGGLYITKWNNSQGFKVWGECVFTDGSNNTYIRIDTPNQVINFFHDIDMHYWSIKNAANVASDGRLKKNIHSSKINARSRTMQMKIRDFNWKKDDKEDMGFIAQELKEIDERYVQHNYKEDEEGNVIEDSMELRHTPLIATNTKAIQEQEIVIQEQQQIINKQQQFIEIVKDKLNLQEEYESIFDNTEVQLMSLEDDEEVVFEGEVVMETSKVLTPAPRYNTVMKYLDDNTVDIYQELAEDSEV